MSMNDLKRRIEKLEERPSELIVVCIKKYNREAHEPNLVSRLDTGQEWIQGEEENLEAFHERIRHDLETEGVTGYVLLC